MKPTSADQSVRPNRPLELRTPAWLLRGISSIPGELLLGSGQISFAAFNTGSAWPWQLRKLERAVGTVGIAQAIDDGVRTVVFHWPADSVQAWCPWYYFGGGIKLRRESLVLRFSLGEPANQQTRFNRLDAGPALEGVSDTAAQVGTMRSRGALWLAALEASREPDRR